MPQWNILIGGGTSRKNLTCVIVRDSFTYHPSKMEKAGIEIGYHNVNNSQILVEGNYFTGGANAMEVRSMCENVINAGCVCFWLTSQQLIPHFFLSSGYCCSIYCRSGPPLYLGTFRATSFHATPICFALRPGSVRLV